MRGNLLILLGGALGALARALAAPLFPGPGLPWGYLLINLSGAFLIGLVMTWALETMRLGEDGRLFWGVGFLGGYTTFSTWMLGVADLARRGQWETAAVYLITAMVLGPIATMAGIGLARGRATAPRPGHGPRAEEGGVEA